MKINQKIIPWIPLLASMPLMTFGWIPGGGRFLNSFILSLLWLSYLSVKLQGRGNRLYSFYGLIAGNVIPLVILFVSNTPKEPGPGEGILFFMVVYYSLVLGILLSSIIGFLVRKTSTA